MSWGQAAEGSSKLGEGTQAASTYGNSVEISSASTPSGGAQPVQPASGFGMDAGSGNTPADGTSVSLTPNQMADKDYYGTANPTFTDKSVNMLERFQKGGENNLAQAWKARGNNPETYGAIYGMANKMAGSGKPAGAAPITTNISYQQPAQQKRGRYW